MTFGNHSTSAKHIFRIALVCFCMFAFHGIALSQITGDGGGGLGDGRVPTDPNFDQGNADNGDTGNTGGGEADGEIDTVDPVRLGAEIEDVRNQGFVGSTAPYTEANGFVGSPSQNNQLGGVAEERFEGGGVNAGRGSRTATTSSSTLQENGFTVVRQSLRSRLRPAFAAPLAPGYVAESRFQSRIARQPVVRNFGSNVKVTVTNRTAVLTGRVGSEAERQIIKRQLRLEPGVYKIDDQTSLTN